MSVSMPRDFAASSTPRASAPAKSAAPPPGSSLALMQKGTGLPVFICHALSGSAWVALPLLRIVKLRRPVYATQAPDLDGPHEVMDLEAMVARYTADLRAVQPQGPYSLIGYSFGALIAFEIANRLTAEGQTIAHLVLLDQPAPPQWPRRALVAARQRVRQALCRAMTIGAVRRAIAPRLGWDPLTTATHCFGAGPLSASELRRLVRLIAPSVSPNVAAPAPFARHCDDAAAALERAIAPAEWQSLIRYARTADNVARVKALKVYAKNLCLTRTYRPRTVFPGRLHIWAAPTTAVTDWQAFTAQPLDLRVVPAPAMADKVGHPSFVETANVALFGDDLRRVLERE
jgi:thioesterase domain-containing protein